MTRAILLYTSVFAAAIAGLLFGDGVIRLLMALLLLIAIGPLWTTVRQTIADHTARAILADASEPPHES